MHIVDFLVKAANRYPDNVVVVHGAAQLTAWQLLEKVYRVSNALLGLGLSKGDRVALLLNNCQQGVESFYGTVRAGLVMVPMNARYSPKELISILNHAEAKAIILGPEFVQTIESIRHEVPSLLHVVAFTEKAPPSMLSYEELLNKASTEEPSVEISENDLISLRYTGGTTGPPKGVIHDHRSNIAILNNILTNDFLIEEGDAIAVSGPITHASGFMILPHIVRGAKVILLSCFDPKEFLETIEREKVKTLYLVPTMIVMMLAHPDLKKHNLSSLKTIRYGASPISPEVLRRGIEVFGSIFVQAYGLTEGGMLLTLLSKRDHLLNGSEKSLKRLCSVGRAVTSVQVKIMDDEGHILPAGEVGEIVVQSDQNMKGYWKNPQATVEALRNGWLHTRDIGWMDEEGYIYLLDRKEDMVISGGFNIYPKEVEDVLYMHPAVLEAAAFGVPDEVWGESIKAVISLKPGMIATEEEIIEHCKNHLAPFKKPKSVNFIQELPKSSYGKILRRTLKEPYWQGRARMIN